MRTNYPSFTLSTTAFFFFDATSGFGGQFAVAAALNVFTVLVLLVMVIWFMRRKQTNVTEVY
jgi:hypothetical protein